MHGRLQQLAAARADYSRKNSLQAPGVLDSIKHLSAGDATDYFCKDGNCGSGFSTLAQGLAEVSNRQFLAIEAFDVLANGLNQTFVLMSAYMVFMMQNGFAMLTAGSVRTKNTKNVLLKNLLDACVGFFAYWLLGYAFAYGSSGNAFIGHSNFALTDTSTDAYHFFFFQWTFAATAATIVSGSVAERTSFYAYLGYAFFLTAFVYPVVSHWVWDGNGWVSSFNGDDPFRGGAIDFAGCSVVHMVGGFAGLTGAAIVGPRIGRFDDEGNVVPMPGHSATLCTLGTFILWFGWYGFNPGSMLGVIYGIDDTGSIRGIARCAVTTTCAAAAGGLTTLVAIKIKDHIYDLLACLNGVLAGLVSITAGCVCVDIWAAMIIGIIGAFVYMISVIILLKLKIDDPLEAYPIHGGCGFWGCFSVGLFARQPYVADAAFGDREGAFFGGGGDLLLANFVTILAVIGWTVGLIGPFFFILKVAGVLRISPEEELVGNDVSKHGGSAYPEDPTATAEAKAAHDLKDFNKDNMGMDDSISKPAEEQAVPADAEV
uniref:Ammonium transporter n=1 Tax=Timspurckia oligopyrenoides TaxID=708627 RepID=A0A7S0ZDQ0_9RHOD|mmetsp:Transcript_13780/g.24724  ORF Transcript_13780/g.24724 Transcript_13780/m.24724 type:complete len:542 (+) Transcript_13780:45-1670(+)